VYVWDFNECVCIYGLCIWWVDVCVCVCNVWVCVCVGFGMWECVFLRVLKCVGVCMSGFCNVWLWLCEVVINVLVFVGVGVINVWLCV